MDTKLQDVSLTNLGSGGAAEQWDHIWAELLRNIQDPNIPAESKRVITLTTTVTPNAKRVDGEITYQVSVKLPGPRAQSSTIFFGERDGQVVAVTRDLRQQHLFDEPDTNVTPIKPTRAG